MGEWASGKCGHDKQWALLLALMVLALMTHYALWIHGMILFDLMEC